VIGAICEETAIPAGRTEIALTPSASDGCRARPRSRLSPRSCFRLCRQPKFRDSVGTIFGLF
jgi:hypothetical protein